MKIRIIPVITVFILIGLIQFNIEATQRGRHILSQVEKGTYVEKDILSPDTLKWMPIPAGTIDYALYQSINRISNVVLGNFKIGDRVITLIQDINADGNVDIVAHWYIDLNRMDKEGAPSVFCSAENFKKLKEIIVNGKNDSISLGGRTYKISPNTFGIAELERLLKRSSNVTKYKQGLRVKRVDPDEQSLEMIVYSFSYNIQDNSADLAFDVRYYDRGQSRVSPIINFGVYCSRSEDPFAIETVKKLREIAKDYFTE